MCGEILSCHTLRERIFLLSLLTQGQSVVFYHQHVLIDFATVAKLCCYVMVVVQLVSSSASRTQEELEHSEREVSACGVEFESCYYKNLMRA